MTCDHFRSTVLIAGGRRLYAVRPSRAFRRLVLGGAKTLRLLGVTGAETVFFAGLGILEVKDRTAFEQPEPLFHAHVAFSVESVSDAGRGRLASSGQVKLVKAEFCRGTSVPYHFLTH